MCISSIRFLMVRMRYGASSHQACLGIIVVGGRHFWFFCLSGGWIFATCIPYTSRTYSMYTNNYVHSQRAARNDKGPPANKYAGHDLKYDTVTRIDKHLMWSLYAWISWQHTSTMLFMLKPSSVFSQHLIYDTVTRTDPISFEIIRHGVLNGTHSPWCSWFCHWVCLGKIYMTTP